MLKTSTVRFTDSDRIVPIDPTDESVGYPQPMPFCASLVRLHHKLGRKLNHLF